MAKRASEQLHTLGGNTGISELLTAHQAISDAWYSNWQAEQRDRLRRLLDSRTSAPFRPDLKASK